MTTELEKQFFDTFGIEPKCDKLDKSFCKGVNKPCNELCPYKHYPQITDRHYLELILIYSEIDELPIGYDTVEHLKEGVLECFIEHGEDCKHQVQAIFKGERWK